MKKARAALAAAVGLILSATGPLAASSAISPLNRITRQSAARTTTTAEQSAPREGHARCTGHDGPRDYYFGNDDA